MMIAAVVGLGGKYAEVAEGVIALVSILMVNDIASL
jgi:hypothetical protein